VRSPESVTLKDYWDTAGTYQSSVCLGWLGWCYGVIYGGALGVVFGACSVLYVYQLDAECGGTYVRLQEMRSLFFVELGE
jgi:hypothetical protein